MMGGLKEMGRQGNVGRIRVGGARDFYGNDDAAFLVGGIFESAELETLKTEDRKRGEQWECNHRENRSGKF